jgi:UDP-glucose 4-epimerase
MRILVVGGAGYVGSFAVRALAAAGHEASILDNFSTGHRRNARGFSVFETDLREPAGIMRVFEKNRFDAVMHFAAACVVSESVRRPEFYFENNVIGTANLLAAMLRHGVGRIVFSSSAAVYGAPRSLPLRETHPRDPVNPYGMTKLIAEALLRKCATARGIAACAFRYFNAAGAMPDGSLGECHSPETHLVPNVLNAAMTGGIVRIFGDDYPTPDGTCVRDYVHVCDLADAHVLALNGLRKGRFLVYNLGSQGGHSVREVIAAAEAVTGGRIRTRISQRREGDPAVLVAGASKARRELGWRPRSGALEDIIASAWEWHRRRTPRDAKGGAKR